MNISSFRDLNLLPLIQKKLENLGFKKITKIQKICIPPALKNFDVIGSARTGSGKTLCFVLPIFQKFFISAWNNSDSIFSVIITPVRELCLQLFHFFDKFNLIASSMVGLLIGKKIFNEKILKKKLILIIATPGYLLNTIFAFPFLNFDSTKILTIDEADKLLDIGFKKFFDILNRHLPRKKQNLIFSATINSKLKNLTRININNPIYGYIKENNKISKEFSKEKYPDVSKKNFQFYSVLKNRKIDILFSFVISHSQRKLLVFFSTKKQVKFYYYILKKLCNNLNLFFIFGEMKQSRRVTNFVGFSRSKTGILLTTDLMARGIDFKLIDWVLQFDCPENIEVYLHRIGRTGRSSDLGNSLLLLKTNEIKFLEQLKKHFLKIYKLKLNFNQITKISEKLKILTKKKKFRKIAHDAFYSYIRFLILQKNKKTFDIRKFDWHATAMDFGITRLIQEKKNH